MAAIAAVDMALWDIKAQGRGDAALPAARRRIPHRPARLRPRLRQGTARAVRLRPRAPGAGLPGDPRADGRAGPEVDLRHRVERDLRADPPRRRALRPRARPARRPADRGGLGHPRLPAPPARPCSRRSATSSAPTAAAARRPPPDDADPGGEARQVARAVRPVLARGLHPGREPGGAAPRAPAHHDAARDRRDLQHGLGLPADHPRAAHRLRPRRRHPHGRHHAAEEDARLRRAVPDQVGHARADRHLAGRHGRRDAPGARDPQLRHPGVHAARREDRRGVPAVVHVGPTGCCTPATSPASASSSTSTRRASTRTSRRTCRTTASPTAPCTTGSGQQTSTSGIQSGLQ